METTSTPAVAMEVSGRSQLQQPVPQTGFTSFACCGSSPLNVAASAVTTTANSEAASAVVVAAAAATTTAAASDVVVVVDTPRPTDNGLPSSIATSAAAGTRQQPAQTTSHLISKSKSLTEEDFVHPTPGGAVGSDRMTELPEGDDSWRAYYEHPLTAATTAMLNINGAGEEQNAGIGLLYEYYKLPPMDKGDKLPLKYAPITEIWSSVQGVPSTVTVVDPSAAAIAVTSSVAGASSPPVLVKEVNGERSVGSPHDVGVTGLAHGQQQQSDVVIYVNQSSAPSPPDGVVVVKREPEDLTSERSSPESGEGRVVDVRRHNGTEGSDPGCCVLVSIKQEPDDSPGPGSGPGLGGQQQQQQTGTGSPSTPSTPSTPVDLDPSKVRVDMAFPVQAFTMAAVTYDNGGAPQYSVLPPAAAGQPQQQQFAAVATGVAAANLRQAAPSYAAVTTDYYRDYVNAAGSAITTTGGANGTGGSAADYYQVVRQQLSYAGDATQENVAFVERYMRQTNNNNNYKGSAGLTVDLPSPDSGIGEAAITPRDSAGLPQIFDYSDLSQNQMVSSDTVVSRSTPTNSVTSGSTRRPWHDFSRSSEAEKIQIPKIFSNVGFRYFLESPISTSQRREDDRITYINKGQFYGISLEYIPDPDKPLKSQTVKSVVLLVFREEKSTEDEIKAWQFWHSRQHSVKQRILDADTKNSTGLVGCIEEVTHNAIAVYWNPLESPAKINVAVQCLSTDFSNQKGVKGLPLHLQIDTYEDVREPGPPVHRGYCQIKVFCDKGAERKTRDEERRAAKRKLTVTGRKKMDELYHPPCDRSEFYSMSDLLKPPMLFSPTEDLDKQLVLSAFRASPTSHYTLEYFDGSSSSGGLGTVADKKGGINADGLLEPTPVEPIFTVPPLKKTKVAPPSDRVMLYIRQDDDEVYTPLHLVPPSLVGLANADYGENGRRDDPSLLQRGHFYYQL